VVVVVVGAPIQDLSFLLLEPFDRNPAPWLQIQLQSRKSSQVGGWLGGWSHITGSAVVLLLYGLEANSVAMSSW
jgi:hypothetical protein